MRVAAVVGSRQEGQERAKHLSCMAVLTHCTLQRCLPHSRALTQGAKAGARP